MNNDSDIAANYEEVLYDTASQAYTIDLVPEPDFVEYDYLSLGAPYPWAGSCPEFNNNWITGVPGGVMVRKYSWFDVSSGARMNETTPFAAGRSYRFEVILDCEEGYYLADPEVLDAYVNGEKAQVTEAEGSGMALTVEYSLAVSSGLHGQVVSFLDGSDVTVSCSPKAVRSPSTPQRFRAERKTAPENIPPPMRFRRLPLVPTL